VDLPEWSTQHCDLACHDAVWGMKLHVIWFSFDCEWGRTQVGLAKRRAGTTAMRKPANNPGAAQSGFIRNALDRNATVRKDRYFLKY